MKKKYIAMAMGLMIAISPMSVYAEDTGNDILTEGAEDINSEDLAEAAEAANDDGLAGTAEAANDDDLAGTAEAANDDDLEGISEDIEGENGEAADSDQGENQGQNTEKLTGRVTGIGDDFITITAMAQGGGGQMPEEPSGENGQPPEEMSGDNEELLEKAAGDSREESEEEPGDTEENPGDAEEEPEDTEEKPENAEEEPEGNEGLSEDGFEKVSGFGESVTVTLTDDTQILKQSTEMFGSGQPGEMSGETPDEGQGGEAPEKPDGEMNGEVPEKSDGEMNGEAPGKPDVEMNGEMPDMPEGDMKSGETEEISLSDIQEGDMVEITLNSDGTAASVVVQSMGQGAGGMAPGGGMGQGSGVDSYDAVQTIDQDTSIEGETIDSTGADENAVLVDGGAEVFLSGVTVNRESADSTGGDDSSFYGVGAALLAADGTLYISDSTITTDASGAAGAFAYGDGTVYVADTDITTRQDTSGGIHAAGGGTLYAWNVTAETNGRSAAAVRSDRGGGLMAVDGGSYTSNGPDSPAVYCTADISINDAELAANGSEAVCIEGLNTLRLYNCDLTGNMSDDERNDNTWTVIVYQSMSGDSEVGNGTFQMVGGTLTSGNGGLFYTTNTECTITLRDVEIISAEDSEFFLQCTGNNNTRGWGQSGSNGSDCLFTAISQAMQGDVVWDSISDLEFYMTEGSTLTGAFVNDETYAGSGGDGVCNVYISEDSSWIVTADSTVSALNCAGSIIDENGNTVTVQGEDGTVYVEGDSEYTVTAESYSGSADLSGCAELDTWEAHAAERPENL